MKKSLVALAALAVTGAFAQSSVTLSGTFDLSVQNSKNDATSATTMAKNGMASSRIQFSGTEDMGQGLKANFICDTTLTPNAGVGYTTGAATVSTAASTGTTTTSAVNTTAAAANNSLCDRQGMVGVSGGFGTLNLGGEYTPLFRLTGVADPFGTNGVGSWYGLAGSLARGGLVAADVSAAVTTIFATGTSPSLAYPGLSASAAGGGIAYTGLASVNAARANNSVIFTSPTFNGVSVSVMHFVDGIAGNATTGKQGAGFSARVRYDAGPLTLAIGAQSVKHATNGTASAAPTAVADLDTMLLVGSYDLGMAKVTFGHQTQEFLSLKAADSILGLVVPMGAGTIKATYAKKTVDTADNTGDFGATQLGVGYSYALSKRTDAYAHYARVANGTNSQYAPNGGIAPTAGRAATAYQVGVRHAF